MMKQTKLNLRLLRKVRDRIAEIPESYHQGQFYLQDERSPCGARACLAGETIICNASTVGRGVAALARMADHFMPADTVAKTNIGKRAAGLLGISEDDANRMFDGAPECSWPAPFDDQYLAARGANALAAVAVAYLDECLKRKAVTW